MNLIKRMYRDGHYSTLAQWTEAHGKAIPPEELLPVNRGVVIYEEVAQPKDESGNDALARMEQPLAVAFVFKDADAPTGWLGFLTSAPNLGPKKAFRACKAAIEAAEELAIKQGVRYMFVNSESPGYARFLQRHGWVCCHEANAEFCKELMWKKGGGL